MSFQGHDEIANANSVAQENLTIKRNTNKSDINGTTLYNFLHLGMTVVQLSRTVNKIAQHSARICMIRSTRYLRCLPYAHRRLLPFRPLPGSYAVSLILYKIFGIINIEVEGKEKTELFLLPMK